MVDIKLDDDWQLTPAATGDARLQMMRQASYRHYRLKH